jgi:hypothetical protein
MRRRSRAEIRRRGFPERNTDSAKPVAEAAKPVAIHVVEFRVCSARVVFTFSGLAFGVRSSSIATFKVPEDYHPRDSRLDWVNLEMLFSADTADRDEPTGISLNRKLTSLSDQHAL